MGKHSIALSILALLAAILACTGTGPVTQEADPTANFATATPGGRISISLLTPTQTFPPNEQDAIPIGPVATQTAAFAEFAEQTATAAQPTPTIAGVLADPAVCPAPGSPTLPQEAPAFTQYAETFAGYLSAGGPPTVLEATLRDWGAITTFGGLVVADRDLTADGVPEVLIVAFDPGAAERFPQPGDLFVFGCDSGTYRLLFRAGYALERGTPQLLSADDINGDFINDIVYAVQTCDGATCFQDVSIVSWSLGVEAFERLLAEEIVEPFAGVEVTDREGDGIREVIITSGTVASVEAGPQRTFTTVLAWNGSLYVPVERTAAAADYRIHVIHDADDSAAAGDYQNAINLYRRAIDAEGLQSWQYPNEEDHLRAYAAYRLMIAQALSGQQGAAQSTHDALLQQFTDNIGGEQPPQPTPEGDATVPPPTLTPTPAFGVAPGVEFSRMANIWWQEYQATNDPGAACTLVIGYVRSNPTAIEVLNTFGFANRSYSAVDVCAFGVVP